MTKLPDLLFAACVVLSATSTSATTVATLTGQPDGSAPETGMIADPSNPGIYYGTTTRGGHNGLGTVFCFNGTTESPIYSFAGGNDGSYPAGRLFFKNGYVYGTTETGGRYGGGTVYKMNVKSTCKISRDVVLHDFGGTNTVGGVPDGFGLHSGVTIVGNVIYGMTREGGSSPSGVCDYPTCGTIYSLPFPNGGADTILHNFQGGTTDGGNPFSGLTYVLQSGLLYGTTENGGTGSCGPTIGCGTLFYIPQGGPYSPTIMHSFGSLSHDGQRPWSGDLLRVGPYLYGTTLYDNVYGYGTVYRAKWTQPCSGTTCYSVQYQFTNQADGELPTEALTVSALNQYLYLPVYTGGPNSCSGPYTGCGVVDKFQITSGVLPPPTQPWTFSGGTDGGHPFSSLVFNSVGTLLYGTSLEGGGSANCTTPYFGCGTIYSVTP